jgi:hypothetical protein
MQWSKASPADQWRHVGLDDRPPRIAACLAARCLQQRRPHCWHRRDDRGTHTEQGRAPLLCRAAGRIAQWCISSERSKAHTHPERQKTRGIPTAGHSHDQGPRRSRCGQNASGADTRGPVLACLLRVQTWTEHAWGLGIYPASVPAAEARQGYSAEPDAISWVIEGEPRRVCRRQVFLSHAALDSASSSA